MLVLVTIVVIAYFYYHVTAFLEPDWRALYSAPGHGPYTHLTRPLLAFCARGDWLARLIATCSAIVILCLEVAIFRLTRNRGPGLGHRYLASSVCMRILY